jgi:predicted nucleic acid-binding protein
MAVIDASVYLSLINAAESDHASSWTWFEETQSIQELISAPVILLAEVAAAVSRGIGNTTLAHAVVEQLQRAKVVELVPISQAMAARAATIAADHRIRGCDAVYLALAEQLGDCLVTLDQQQLERGAAVVITRKPE